MFNWRLFFILLLISLPGLLISTPRLLTGLQSTIESNLKPGQSLPPMPILITIGVLQNIVIVGLAAAVGTLTSPMTGLDAPILRALFSGEGLRSDDQTAVFAALIWSVPSTLIFLLVYYQVIRPRLDVQTVMITETLRRRLGIWSRLLYGGIVEEVIVRWGLMGLIVWLMTLIIGQTTAVGLWIGIIGAGLIFGLGHLPSHFAAGCRKTPFFIGSVVGLNLWLSLIYGWLFWQNGLLAAMIGHMLTHLMWWPLEQRYRMPSSAN